MNKIWSYISIFFLGIISGISIYIKLLDEPETTNEIVIKKIKNKNSDGNSTNLNLEIESTNISRRDKRKNKRIIRKNKNNEKDN